jgi:hypothetical protein
MELKCQKTQQIQCPANNFRPMGSVYEIVPAVKALLNKRGG